MRASYLESVLAVSMLAACGDAAVTDPVPEPPPLDDEPVLTDTSEPADTGALPSCVQVRALSPHHGSAEVYHRAPFLVELDGDGRGLLEVLLRREDGANRSAAISGWSEDGRRALITTPEPLLVEHRFRLRARTACSERIADFETSSVGLPVASGSVAPAVFRIDTSGLRSLLPALDDHALRMAVDAWPTLDLAIESWNPIDRSYEVAFYGEPTSPELPARCDRRVELAPTSGWTLTGNPFLRMDVNGSEAILPLALAGPLGLGALQLDLDGIDPRVPVRATRVVMSASLSPDRQRLDGLRLAVVVDARDVQQGLAADDVRTSVDQLCLRASGFGASCEPCDDGRRACVLSDIDGLSAVRVQPEESCLPAN